MEIGESFEIFPWFVFYFVENNGFAFGLEFFGNTGKVFLTFFRLFFSYFIFKWMVKTITVHGFSLGAMALVLIFSGAVGNIIDSVFYGLFFDYSPLFFGKVVDFLYFPLFEGVYPVWFPFVGGDSFVFFGYVFNIADSAITIGAFLLLFSHRDVSFDQ